MAHLNVQERRIEAKIAYVGAQLAGKATNFERLRREPSARTGDEAGDDLLSLQWHPGGASTFRDCDVTVKLVAQRGALEAGATRDLLRDADGVVLVVDATPDAGERNRTSFAAVKEALATSPTRQVPIVVQVNKSDVEGALAASEVARALESEAWPHVVASAVRGEGVVETLQRAVEQDLQSMRDAEGTEATREEGAPFVPDETRRGEGNPLLTALKQVLRDTVTHHLTELETRQSARLDAEIGRSFDETRSALERHGDRRRGALEKRFDETRATLARIEDAVMGLAAAQAALQASVAAERERVDRTITRALDDVAKKRDVTGLARREDVSGLAKTEDVAAATEAFTKGTRDIEPRLRTELETLRKETKRDLTKLIEATTRAERDTAAALDTITSEVAQTARAAASVPPRLAEIEAKLRSEVAEIVGARATSLERTMHSATADTQKAIGHVDGRAADVQEQLTELIDELKKRKKGWFS